MNQTTALIASAAVVISSATTELMRRYALRRNLLDVPNARSSHAVPTPRGGGVGIVVAFFVTALVLAMTGQIGARLLAALLLGGGMTALIGFLDDRRPQPARIRFLVHACAAVCAVMLIGSMPDRVLLHWGLQVAWIGYVLTVIAVVWVTNLFNFMDGIDGIAAAEAVFVAGAGAAFNACYGGDSGLTAAFLCLAGASLGFLFRNWPPAKIFMGDVGSGFVGFMLAALGLAASQPGTFPIEVWIILGGAFFVDATLTLIMRIARGERWYEAHRSHAYQRLARRWNAHLPVTLLLTIINLFWLLPWAICAASYPARASLSLAAALLPLAAAVVACNATRDSPT